MFIREISNNYVNIYVNKKINCLLHVYYYINYTHFYQVSFKFSICLFFFLA